jgi:hypothetical protein
MMDGTLDNMWTSRFSFTAKQPIVQTSRSSREETAFIREDRRARFYEKYRQVAEEYDKEFLEEYSEDLGATLTFVSPA